jgi:3'-5' exoribonuclease
MVDKLKAYAQKFNLQGVSSVVLDDPRFATWAGASKPHQHHYRKGGLAEHTLEVVELCLTNNLYFQHDKAKHSDPRHLFLAALFHDAGKMWDYEPTNDEMSEWTGTLHKRRIHHISRSALTWNDAYNLHAPPGIELVHAEEILHAILAHHGLREWGSPVSPNTRIAWMLHLCDGISARMDDADKWDQRT